MFSYDEKASGEAVAEFLAPRDAGRGGEADVDQVERCQQEKRFVRPFMGSAFRQRCCPDIEIVETFNGGREEHGIKKAG